MNKEEFNSLFVEQQVDVFNDLLKNNSIRKTCESIGIGKTTVRDRFKKHGYIFNSKTNQYEKDFICIENKKEIKSNKNLTKVSNSNLTKVNKSNMDKIYEELRELLDLKEDIKALLERENLRGRIIEVPELRINKFTGDLKPKTIKVYENVLEEFNKFVEEHNEYKQQDIVSQALWEFIQKYK